MNENITATRPRVKTSPDGKWYLYFSIRNPKTGRLHPVKIEKGFKNLADDKEREKYGKKLAEEYTKKIESGWTPWNNGEYIFSDQICYAKESESYGNRRKSNITVRFLSSEFLLQYKTSLKPKSYSSYQSKMRIFCIWIQNNGYANHDITAINNKVILLFFDYLVNKRDLDKVTIKAYKVKLNSFFAYLIKTKKITTNPVYNIPSGQKKCDAAPRPIFPGDMKKLLTLINQDDPQLYLACMMQFYCAIRPGTELRFLKIKHIDFWKQTIMINLLDAKTERQEYISIPNQLFELITNKYQLQNYNREFYVFGRNGMPGPEPLGKNYMRLHFNKYRDMLNLSKEYKFYSMKHTGAGMLLDNGFNLKELMEHLRHSDIQSTYHYIRKYKGSYCEKIRNNFPDPY